MTLDASNGTERIRISTWSKGQKALARFFRMERYRMLDTQIVLSLKLVGLHLVSSSLDTACKLSSNQEETPGIEPQEVRCAAGASRLEALGHYCRSWSLVLTLLSIRTAD